ncbi:MAG: YDG domain-containing protein, partial [Pelosinus sp.]|nr:YDG domain-containing protein [Pelosinus sp.]
NVGSGKPVNITGLTLDGAEKDNYTLPSTGGAIGNITAKTLTLNPVAANKTYDGTTAATLTDYGLNGLVGSETLQISSVSKFSDKNAGDKKTVTISAISLLDGTNGGLASNYHIDSTAIAVADIAKRPINVVGITAQDKTYDSTTAAILNTSGAGLTNTIAGDNVSLLTSSAKGTFSDGTVGNGKTVTVTELALSGTDIGNYQLAPYTTLANINNSQSSNQQTDAAIKTAITQPATEATSAQNNQSPTTSGTTTVVVEKGGVNNETTVTQPPKAPAPANQPTSAPNNQPSATGLAGALRVTSVGGTAENYSMTITNQSVIITLPSTGAQGANTAAPSSTKEVTASGVALVMVGAHGVETVVDTCNITATASSLTVTSVAGASTMQPKAERPSEQTSGAKTDTFKITKADGSVAEFSVTYAGGAISIKPLNAEAAELSKESGAGLKAVAATAILTAEDKLGVAASDVAAVYVQN